MANNISNFHPEYQETLVDWITVEDATKGQRQVKKKATIYLPSADNQSSENDPQGLRYASYLKRAIYYNFVGRTVSGLAGVAFKNGVTIEGSGLQFIADDFDGEGVNIKQSSKAAVTECLKTGRGGILVDYPESGGVSSVADQISKGVRPVGLNYKANEVINWDSRKIGATKRLSLVVLREIDYKMGANYRYEENFKTRVLELGEDGLYTVTVYEGDDSIGQVFEPRNSVGNRLDYIPFYFYGSVNNDSNVDESPVLPMADINIGHYRNSADYEHSSWAVGQPQPWANGLDQNWVDNNLSGFSLGSGTMLALPVGSNFGIEQVSPNTQAREAMLDKQAALVSMGAKLITPQTSFGTATEAALSSESENSTLQTIVDNVQDAYNKALMAMADFSGEQTPVFTINADLTAFNDNPQMATVMLQAWQAGLIAKIDTRGYFRDKGLVDRTDEEIDEDIENGGNLIDALGDDQ